MIRASEWGLVPDNEEDMTLLLRDALETAPGGCGKRLVFDPGRYDFWPDRAFEKYLFVSNNDEGLKRIAFPLVGGNGWEIDGQGAEFVFHGPMVPFLLEGLNGVSIRNLSIDFSRTFHSEGVVTSLGKDSVDLAISKDFPYEVRSGVLVFTDGGGTRGPATTVKSGERLYPYGSLLAFDPSRRETSFMAWDKYHLENGVAAQELEPGKVRIFAANVSAQVGDVLVFSAGERSCPGFVISDSSDVVLENVTIHHCGGMGVIAQRSSNLLLDRVQVTPGRGRMISSSADATHFANCRGFVTIESCLFENQMDDGANFHGIYSQISRILDSQSFEVRLVHPQQAGFDFIREGMRLEVTRSKSLRAIGEVVVASIRRFNKEFSIVSVCEPLPADFQEGDVVADADANTAEVSIRNCVLRGNRARGVLLGSRGKTVLENNVFHTPGAAILFEGDACHWFEQAGVRDVAIRRNIFEDCNFGVWGDAAIEVRSGISRDARKTSRYNRNIRIESNIFRTFGNNPVLDVYSVDGLVFADNRIEPTISYPKARENQVGPVIVTDSDGVVVREKVEKSASKMSLPDPEVKRLLLNSKPA